MTAVVKTRGAFAALCLVASPTLVFAVAWALDGLGLRTDQLSLGAYAAFLAGLPALLVVALGKLARRNDLEITAVLIVSVGWTFLLAFLFVARALSHAGLN